MPDMLVKLYDLPKDDGGLEARLAADNIVIRRAMAPDKLRILPRVQEISSLSAAGECDVCFAHTPISCFIATAGAQIIGYACYDATTMNFFGPTAVDKAWRGKGIGKALLLRSMHAMADEGFGYAIIGSVGPAAFYEKVVGATIIPDSDPGVYKDFVGRLERLEKEDK